MAWAQVNLQNSFKIDKVVKISGLYDVLKHTNAYLGLNVCVNSLNRQILPAGHDIYVLSFWHEVFDEQWFLQNYNTHKNSQFIVLSDFLPNGLEKYSRVKHVRLLHWKCFTGSDQCVPIDWSAKKYKISSLSYYVNEFRYFVTAALFKKANMLVSWHNHYRSYSNCEYIFEKTGYSNRDQLLQYKDDLLEKLIIDNVKNDPEYNYKQSRVIPAYKETLVNCTNETKDIGWVNGFGDSPGPYLTEKTWKPLKAGTAIVFTGQYNTKYVLEQAGFKFNYPWSNQYDEISGDLERLEKIIELLDVISNMPFEQILEGITESCEHNIDYLTSKRFDQYIDNTNLAGLEKLETLLK